jgi:membrane-bound lytic murein transglycosylase B
MYTAIVRAAWFLALAVLVQPPVVQPPVAQPPVAQPRAAEAAVVPTPVAPSPAPRPSFSDFLAGVRTEALTHGIRQEILDDALGHIEEPLPVVIERDRAQAESVLPLERYVSRLLTPKKIKAGREVLDRHRALLDQVGERYGVPPRIIVGIWGLESNFGRFSGIRPTIAALATLAWDPRRAAFFRGELFAALEILNRGDIELSEMRGSWAGAMGQAQFMPSSFLRFAEDFDGDGRRDIWSTPADVFASIANYLKGHGWIVGQTWGREVKVSAEIARRITNSVERRNGTCQATRDMTIALPIARWQELGVRLPGGQALPAKAPDASLVSGATRHFLVYRNYDVLLDYNCAHSYAVSVALLGDAIASGSPVQAQTNSPKSAAHRR